MVLLWLISTWKHTLALITPHCTADSNPSLITMEDAYIRETRLNILDEIEDMDIELLKRIAYECRCEENGIYPDHTYIRW